MTGQQPLVVPRGEAASSAAVPAESVYAMQRALGRQDAQLRELDAAIVDLRRTLRAVEDAQPMDTASSADVAAERARIDTVDDILGALLARVDRLESRIAALEARPTAASQARDAVRAGQLLGPVDRPQSVPAPSPPADLNPVARSAAEMASDAHAVHLASYRDMETLRDGWRNLRAEHADMLASYEARVDELNLPDFGGRFYRLKAGPLATMKDAAELCGAAEKRGLYCEPTRFDGNKVK